MNLALFSAAALGAILLAAAGPGSPSAGAAGQPSVAVSAAAVDPEAITALERMSGYLRSLKSFEMNATTSIDEEVDGQLITFDGTTTYKVRAPNAFLIRMATDRKVRDVYYDGKQVTVFSPRMKLYGRFAAPGTIKETLQLADEKYGVQLPLADLFYWGTEKARTDDLLSGAYIGPAKCGQAVCDQFAFRQAGLDWQIWIEQGERPVPRKVVITTLYDDVQPRFSAQLDWTVNPTLDDAVFVFTPPPGSYAIPIVTASK